MVRIEGDEDPLYYRSENVTRSDLMNWIRSLSLPLLPEFRGRAYNDIVRSGKLTLLFALDSSALIDNEQIAQLKQIVRSLPVSVESIETADRKLKREFAFAYLDGNEWDEYLRFYGVSTKRLPCALVIQERVGEAERDER